MTWEVEYTDEFEAWWLGLDEEQQEAIDARIELLEASGPNLGRPIVDTINGSKFENMKELRVAKGGALRILFIFDPLRNAILLVGGDKSDAGWNDWYPNAITEADRLYETHLAQLRREGLLPP